jgi:hypothetical protein
LLDDRTANLFANEAQFTAFRQALTTRAARKAIPVDDQYAIAKEIMRPKCDDAEADRKVVTSGYIKMHVEDHVKQYTKEQRKIDKEERDAYFASRWRQRSMTDYAKRKAQ